MICGALLQLSSAKRAVIVQRYYLDFSEQEMIHGAMAIIPPRPVAAMEILARAETSAHDSRTVGLLSYHGVLVIEQTDGTHRTSHEGEVWFRSPDQLRTQIVNPVGSDSIIISHGADSWAGPAKDGAYEHHAGGLGATNAMFLPQDSLEGILLAMRETDNPPSIVGMEQIADRTAYVISIPETESLQGMGGTVWIDNEYYLILKMELHSANGASVTMGFTSFEANPGLDPNLFAIPSHVVEAPPINIEDAISVKITWPLPNGSYSEYETNAGIGVGVSVETSGSALTCTVDQAEATRGSRLSGVYERTGPTTPVIIGRWAGIFCPSTRMLLNDPRRWAGELVFERDGAWIRLWLAESGAEYELSDFVEIAQEIEPVMK